MFRTKEDCSFIMHIIHGKKEYKDINKKQQFSKITMQIILQNI